MTLARRTPADPAAAARAALRHLGLDGAVRPRLPAPADFGGRQRRAGRGVRLRDPADPADARAGRAQPRGGDPAGRRRGARTGRAARASARRCETFNDRYGRRGMARGAVVVILSDGWERADPALVGREMERLRRDWPIGSSGSTRGPAPPASRPVPGGMAAALPHCDALVSGHSPRGPRRGRRGDGRRRPRRVSWPPSAEARAVMAERRADRGAAARAHAQRLRPQAGRTTA